MKIFRQDKIELTPGDWRLMAAYLVVMCLWLVYRFSVEGYAPLEILLDISANLVKLMASFFAIKFLIERFFLQQKLWLVGVILIVIALVLIGGAANIFGTLTGGGKWQDPIYPLNNFVIQGLYTALFEVALLIGVVFSKKSYDQYVNNYQLAVKNRENELRILRAQFSPHFLFNNLNTIDALIDDRPAEAKAYVSHLAKLYRYITHSVDQELMSVEDELAFIRNYLFLLEVRYREDYAFSINVTQDLEERFLPAGALQTVVENIVKHNAYDGTTIESAITIKDELVIVRNAKGIQQTGGVLGTGIDNLGKRYRLLSGQSLVVRDEADFYEIQLPLIQIEPN
ncbi:MAG: sensor histidine kinase [Bacteroidota bacterium]